MQVNNDTSIIAGLRYGSRNTINVIFNGSAFMTGGGVMPNHPTGNEKEMEIGLHEVRTSRLALEPARLGPQEPIYTDVSQDETVVRTQEMRIRDISGMEPESGSPAGQHGQPTGHPASDT